MILDSAKTAREAVCVTSVSKHFVSAGQRVEVLNNVSVTIPKRRFFALTGVSGSGKTTLLNLIGGLDVPSSGRIEVFGREVSALSPGQRTQFRQSHVGFIFQFYNLMPTLTAGENVELALEISGYPGAERREMARHWLHSVGLENKADRFPAQLSGGEQQRIAIARALAKAPALVLADEPTGNLDRATGRSIMTLMRELNASSGTTFVIVTHDPEVAALADASYAVGETPPVPSGVELGVA